jgi:hypothetical protein
MQTEGSKEVCLVFERYTMPTVKNSTEFFTYKVIWVNGLHIIHKHYNLDLQSQQQSKLDHWLVKAWTLYAQQRVQEPFLVYWAVLDQYALMAEWIRPIWSSRWWNVEKMSFRASSVRLWLIQCQECHLRASPLMEPQRCSPLHWLLIFFGQGSQRMTHVTVDQ